MDLVSEINVYIYVNFVLCSVYLVEYTLNPNSMIKIAPEH